MSALKNEKKDLMQGGNSAKSQQYQIPAVIRDDKEGVSLEKALFWALILHPVLILILLVCSFILKVLGIEFNLFNKPQIQPKQDIEFVLVDKEDKPINKNTKYRADKSSRAGGKHDPKKPVSMPEQSAPKSNDKKPSAPSKKQPSQAQMQKQQMKSTKQSPEPAPKQEQVMPAPRPEAPKPTMVPSKMAPKPNPTSSFNVPVPPKTVIPTAQPSTAPVTTSPIKSSGDGKGTGNSGSSSPSPSFSPTTASKGSKGASGNGKGTGGGGRFSGSGNSRGNIGNPGPGNPNGAPGIDAVKEPDFGPYMKELQRRIKMNWDPPKGNESKRVILLFSIARDGRLLNIKVNKSSGLQSADNAAINAVKLTAPFRPLPPEFRQNKVDIQFTFDYTVFGVEGY